MYAMYDGCVVRKQVYIREDQERQLKRRARELGVREAELIRRALDHFLAGEEEGPLPQAEEALAAFLEASRALAGRHRLPEGWRFDREALYEEEARGRR